MDNVDLSSDDRLERMLRELNDPIEIAKNRAEGAFIDDVILQGLPRLHASWMDALDNRYFAAAEFRTAIERCTEHGVLIIGIEVFTSRAEMLELRIREEGEETNDWCRDLLKQYEGRRKLFFYASYRVPLEAIADDLGQRH